MASAMINVSIDDTTTTLLVVFPHGVEDDKVKDVLRTIYDWSIDFNGNNPVRSHH
jgi:hypothetical protein